ncbi:beta-N-acetylhexosaminidase [Alishewanella longhuensis]
MEARYQRYNIAEQPEEAVRYRLTEDFDHSAYLSVQRYTDNAVNVCQESTYAFIDKVIAELQLMYEEAGLRLAIFHMGGDEVAKEAWEQDLPANN